MATIQNGSRPAFQIGELARRTALSIYAIRFYERRKLLTSSSRTAGRFRLYTAHDIERLRFVQRIQRLGFSLEEIKQLMGIRADIAHICSSVGQSLKTKLADVTVKIRELRQLEAELKTDLSKCNRALSRQRGKSVCLPCTRRRRRNENRMKIEVLYFAGCPNHLPAMEIVCETLNSLDRAHEIHQTEIRTQAEAEAMGFIGSPSIRIDGADIEPWARAAKTFGLSCRTYSQGSQRGGVPSREQLRRAIGETIRESR